MSSVLSAVGVALAGVFLAFILSEVGYRGARLVAVSASIVLLILASGKLSELIGELGWISEAAGIGDAAATALKIIGIGYVSGICYDVCLDMGQRGVASAVLTVGKVEILLVVAPMISEVLRLATNML